MLVELHLFNNLIILSMCICNAKNIYFFFQKGKVEETLLKKKKQKEKVEEITGTKASFQMIFIGSKGKPMA